MPVSTSPTATFVEPNGAVAWVAEQLPDDGDLPGRLLGLVMDGLTRP